MAGCQRAPGIHAGYDTTRTTTSTDRAREWNLRGLELAEARALQAAGRAFREALRQDVSFAAAHNNLGNVLLASGRLYEAAMEFRFATRLAPAAPQPHVNLGRLCEAAGWPADASAHYERALTLAPDCLAAAGRLARLYHRRGQRPQRLHDLLEQLAGPGSRPSPWRQWAAQRLHPPAQEDSP